MPSLGIEQTFGVAGIRRTDVSSALQIFEEESLLASKAHFLFKKNHKSDNTRNLGCRII